MGGDPTEPTPDERIDAVEFYWRPGCMYCMGLRFGLRRAGIPMNRRNIWKNPDDADAVRAVANGNETGPTVMIGQLALVNPTVSEVKEALSERAPHLL
ncbi:MAG: glutaredoxin domain-containing protein [Acidimicrobiales bacterium]